MVMVDVTQEDRDAAESWVEEQFLILQEDDFGYLIKAFAKHREDAEERGRVQGAKSTINIIHKAPIVMEYDGSQWISYDVIKDIQP